MVIITGSAKTIGNLSGTTWLFLILSGLATGASWLCYFKALQLGDINIMAWLLVFAKGKQLTVKEK